MLERMGRRSNRGSEGGLQYSLVTKPGYMYHVITMAMGPHHLGGHGIA